MNIYALEGHKVRCITFSAGYDYDKEMAKKHLELNKEYTVDYTSVDGYSTDVHLKEFPNIKFNSVFFEDVVEQSEEDDKNHPMWSWYNT